MTFTVAGSPLMEVAVFAGMLAVVTSPVLAQRGGGGCGGNNPAIVSLKTVAPPVPTGLDAYVLAKPLWALWARPCSGICRLVAMEPPLARAAISTRVRTIVCRTSFQDLTQL